MAVGQLGYLLTVLSEFFLLCDLTILPLLGKVSESKVPGRFPSGQRGQTVNLLAQPSKVRILLSP